MWGGSEEFAIKLAGQRLNPGSVLFFQPLVATEGGDGRLALGALNAGTGARRSAPTLTRTHDTGPTLDKPEPTTSGPAAGRDLRDQEAATAAPENQPARPPSPDCSPRSDLLPCHLPLPAPLPGAADWRWAGTAASAGAG